MAAEIKTAFKIDTRLIPEGKGIFDVEVDGRLVYSKYKTGKFPDPGEIERLLHQA